MKDEAKTREQLLDEVVELRRRITELEGIAIEWRRSEEALQQSEERYRLLIDTIPQIVWRSDAHNGGVVEFNRRWYEYTGQTPEEARGSGCMDVVHPDDVAMVTQRVQAAVDAGESVQIEHRLRRASDGSYRWHLVRSVPVKDRDGRVIARFGSATDIDDQKRVEEELGRNRSTLQTTIDNLPFDFFAIGMDGRYTLQDATSKAQWGDLVGKRPEDVVEDEKTLALWRENNRRAFAGEKVEEDVTLMVNGEKRYYHNVIVPIIDEDHIRGILGMNVDVTERKRAEEVLRKTRDQLEQKVQSRTVELTRANEELAFFRKFAEASGQGFSMADLDGRITYVNPALSRILGEERPEEVIGKQLSSFFSEESNCRGDQEILPALNQKGHWEGELSMRSRQGRAIPTWHNTFVIRDESGSALRFAVVITDITERKRAEEALRQSEEKYRSLVEASPEAVLMADFDGKVTFASQRAAELHGCEAVDELIGRNPLTFIAPEDHPKFFAGLQRIQEGGGAKNVEYCFIRKDGTRYPGEVSGALVKDASGKPVALMALVRDVTERKRAHEALERQRRTLKHMLRASDHERQLIAYDIHDGLAQQLAGAIMQFEVFDHLKEAQPKQAADAWSAAMTMLRQGLSEARRLVSGVRPPILDESGVVAAIAHLVNDRGFKVGPHIVFHSSVMFNRLAVILENVIYRIIQEGLTNAARYSQSEMVRVTLRQRDSKVRIEIRDWGVGFDPKAVPTDRFGLAGIRERAHLLGGKCRIQSKPDEGTAILVELPLAEREAAEQ